MELHDKLIPDASELVNRGGLLLDMDRYSDALESFSKAIDLQHKQKGICIVGSMEKHVILKPSQAPMIADAYIGKGRALHGLGRYEDALKSFDLAIALEEVLSETYYYFTYAYLYKGKTLEHIGKKDEATITYDKAMRALDLVIEKQPEDGSVYIEKSEILMELGRHDEAAKAFKMAKELKPELYAHIPENYGERKSDD